VRNLTDLQSRIDNGPLLNYVGRDNWNDRTVTGLQNPQLFDANSGRTWYFGRFSDSYSNNGLALGQVEPVRMGGGETSPQASAPAWTSAGGLSLPLTIPAAEQELRFSKVGGDPKLTLSVRPRRTLTLGLGALWTVVCLVGGLWLVRAATRNEGRDAWRAIPTAMMAVGLLGFLLIPNGFRWVLFAAFALGALAYAIQRRQMPLADEE